MIVSWHRFSTGTFTFLIIIVKSFFGFLLYNLFVSNYVQSNFISVDKVLLVGVLIDGEIRTHGVLPFKNDICTLCAISEVNRSLNW